MEVDARAPDPLTETTNMARTWNTWKEEFQIFMTLRGYRKEPQGMNAVLFKNRIGPVGLQAIESLSFDNPQDKDNMDILIAKLDLHFDPAKNEPLQRFHFFARSKANNETIDDYVAVLKDKSKACNFGIATDGLIRDKVVLQIKDKEFRRKVLGTENLDLPKVISMYRDHEGQIPKQAQKNNADEESQLEKGKSSLPSENRKGCCWRCGMKHPKGNCSAWGHKCQTCGIMNHFDGNCRKDAPKRNEKEINKFKGSINKNILNPGDKTNKSIKCNNFIAKASPNAFSPPSAPQPSKTAPSAPELSDIDNKIYPNLNRMKIDESTPYSSPGQRNPGLRGPTRVTNNFQQNTPALNLGQRPAGLRNTREKPLIHNLRTIRQTNEPKEQDTGPCKIS